MKNFKLNICTLACMLTGALSVNAQWTQTNGPDGGNIVCIAFSGTNIFAGVDGAGIFLSPDTGKNWTAVNNGLTNFHIQSIAISDSNIFVGTGEAGMFLSTNNGNSWVAINNRGLPDYSEGIESIVVNGSNIYAASGDEEVYFSSDNGNSWKDISNGMILGMATSMAVSGSNIFVGSNYDGIYLSSDNGATWTTANNGLTDTTDGIGTIIADGTNIFAGTDSGLFLSVDTGKSWSKVNIGLPDAFIASLAISDSNIVVGAFSNDFLSNGMFLSTNHGNSWRAINDSIGNNFLLPLTIKNSYIFATTSSDLYISQDDGVSWSVSHNGLKGSPISAIGIIGSKIFAGSSNGMYKSTDNGNHWSLDSNLLGYIGAIAVSDSAIITGIEEELYLSTDNGVSWSDINHSQIYDEIWNIAINGSSIFAAGTNDVYLSTDAGNSWTAIDNGLPRTGIIYSLTVLGGNVYLGDIDGVYLFQSGGNNWIAKNNGLPQSPYPDVSSLAAIDSNIFAATGNGVYLLKSNTTNWVPVNVGLDSNLSINSIISSGKYLFAATSKLDSDGSQVNEIFLSTNQGTNWRNISSGLSHGFINTLSTNDTDVFVGTYGSGVWKLALSDIPECGADFSIYPDTSQLHHYIIVNNAFGMPPISYNWSWGDGTNDSIPYPSHTYADSGFYNICLTIKDSTGCTNTFCDSSFHAMRTTNTMIYISVVPSNVTGIKEISPQTAQVVIYPNPATNQLTIHTSLPNNKANVSIMNMLGEVMQAHSLSFGEGRGEASLDVSKLAAGIYFVEVFSETERWVGKFVKSAKNE